MPDDWRPSGQWMKRFREALDDAFDEPSMELLTSDYFPARDAFSKISPPGFGKTFQFRLHELITQARMGGWLPDLVAAARERRPADQAIGRIAEELGLTITGPRTDNPTGRTLEEVVQAHARFINPADFYARLPQPGRTGVLDPGSRRRRHRLPGRAGPGAHQPARRRSESPPGRPARRTWHAGSTTGNRWTARHSARSS